MADTGDIRFLNICRRHLDIFAADPKFDPSNPKLKVAALAAKLDGGYPIAKDVSDMFAAQQIVVNNRQDVYARIPPFARSAQGFRAFAGNVSAYKPNEDLLKLTSIDALIVDCGSANNAVSVGFVPLSSAWNLRDEDLYTDADSILEDFRLAKEYYKSLYNAKDPQYKAITAKDMKLRDNSR